MFTLIIILFICECEFSLRRTLIMTHMSNAQNQKIIISHTFEGNTKQQKKRQKKISPSNCWKPKGFNTTIASTLIYWFSMKCVYRDNNWSYQTDGDRDIDQPNYKYSLSHILHTRNFQCWMGIIIFQNTIFSKCLSIPDWWYLKSMFPYSVVLFYWVWCHYLCYM